MSEPTRAVRVDKVTGTFFKRDRCGVCGKQAERSKQIEAATYELMVAKGRRWEDEPTLHKRCEPMWDDERGCPIGTPVQKGEA